MAGGDGATSARRRRERKLRSFLRPLARALQKSAQPAGPVKVEPSEGEVRETYDALRRLKAPLPGKHPGVVTWLPVLLSLEVASLAGGDEIDATTTRYLLKCALRKRQKEEEEERRRNEKKEEEELFKRVQRVIDDAASFSSSSGKGGRRRGGRESSRSLGADSFLLVVDVLRS